MNPIPPFGIYKPRRIKRRQLTYTLLYSLYSKCYEFLVYLLYMESPVFQPFWPHSTVDTSNGSNPVYRAGMLASGILRGEMALAHVFVFGVDNWIVDQGDPFISIPTTEHGKSSCPLLRITSPSPPYKEVGVYNTISSNGDVVIYTQPGLLFSGKITIY